MECRWPGGYELCVDEQASQSPTFPGCWLETTTELIQSFETFHAYCLGKAAWCRHPYFHQCLVEDLWVIAVRLYPQPEVTIHRSLPPQGMTAIGQNLECQMGPSFESDQGQSTGRLPVGRSRATWWYPAEPGLSALVRIDRAVREILPDYSLWVV